MDHWVTEMAIFLQVALAHWRSLLRLAEEAPDVSPNDKYTLLSDLMSPILLALVAMPETVDGQSQDPSQAPPLWIEVCSMPCQYRSCVYDVGIPAKLGMLRLDICILWSRTGSFGTLLSPLYTAVLVDSTWSGRPHISANAVLCYAGHAAATVS